MNRIKCILALSISILKRLHWSILYFNKNFKLNVLNMSIIISNIYALVCIHTYCCPLSVLGTVNILNLIFLSNWIVPYLYLLVSIVNMHLLIKSLFFKQWVVYLSRLGLIIKKLIVQVSNKVIKNIMSKWKTFSTFIIEFLLFFIVFKIGSISMKFHQ